MFTASPQVWRPQQSWSFTISVENEATSPASSTRSADCFPARCASCGSERQIGHGVKELDCNWHHSEVFKVDVYFRIVQSTVAEKLPDEFENSGGDELVDEEAVMFQGIGHGTTGAARLVLRSIDQLRMLYPGIRVKDKTSSDKTRKMMLY